MPKWAGFSLIEILISLVILSFLLLGFDAAELFSLQASRHAFYFTVAQEQLSSMAERLAFHRSAGDMSKQINQWNQENRTLLPLGKGYVSQIAEGYNITLFWGEKTTQKICKEIKKGELNCLTLKIGKSLKNN